MFGPSICNPICIFAYEHCGLEALEVEVQVCKVRSNALALKEHKRGHGGALRQNSPY